MRNRIIAGLAGFILVGSFSALATPAQAAASSVQAVPTDCTVDVAGYRTVELTCTDRPAGQQWKVFAYCVTWRVPSTAVGNVVIGNGTSTGVCDPNFGIINEENVYLLEA